jgi:hypothetical protein
MAQDISRRVVYALPVIGIHGIRYTGHFDGNVLAVYLNQGVT